MRFWLLTVLTLFLYGARAQQADSLVSATVQKGLDSLKIPQNPLDSIEHSFYSKADSLKQSYRAEFSSLDSSRNTIQTKLDSIQSLQLPTAKLSRKIDSLQSLQLPTEKYTRKLDSLQSLQLPAGKYTAKLDSINNKREEAVASLNKKVEDLKAKSVGRIKELDLPPELKDKASSVTQNIDGFKLPVKDLNIPSLDMPNSPLKGLDGLNTSIESPIGKIGEIDGLKMDGLKMDGLKIDGLSDVQGQLGDVSKITGQAGDYTKDLKSITQGDLQGATKISADVEGKAGELAGVGELQKQSAALDPLKNSVQNPDAAKEQAMQQVKQVAVDHFAGKEKQLQEAMDKMSKLKQKYSSLNSLSEIPKRRPNEMRGKPLIERLVPGIALQIQKKSNDLLTDFNPYIGYRFSGRITGGPGWNQRVGYNTRNNSFTPESRVYGPRIFGEFKLGRGFFPRLEGEVMNTAVPPLIQTMTSDLRERQWVYGAFAGMKKEFRFLKGVRGTSMVMLRLFNPQHKSPYVDVLNVRFGFEFPMKKKAKKKDPKE